MGGTPWPRGRDPRSPGLSFPLSAIPGYPARWYPQPSAVLPVAAQQRQPSLFEDDSAKLLGAKELSKFGDLPKWVVPRDVRRFDRDRHPGLAAHETFTRGCISQMGRRHREALAFLSEAQRRFDQLHQPLDCALAANQAVESHYCLGEETEAVRCCVAAARFFEEAGCPLDTLDAVSKLEALVRAHASTKAVAASVRRLARRHGGWLPEPNE